MTPEQIAAMTAAKRASAEAVLKPKPRKVVNEYALQISRYSREDQIKIIRAVMERPHIGIRDFADSKIKFRF